MQEGLEAGQKFERYRVLRFLGNGISGESYEAEDMFLRRTVHLKLIHPWLMLSDSIRRQFFRDMQHISSITHPYLAEILDYGEADSQLYMVRRYVGSGSLLNSEGRTWFNPPLVLADAITYTHQLAQALQHLHDHGQTHGSLTFSNIMVVRNSLPNQEPDVAPFLLADPGTACFVRRLGIPRITLLPISAAPEHLEKHFIPAGDQYALATLLYFWLAGRPPFLGSPDMLLQQKLTNTITPLTMFNPRVSPRQEEVVHRALSCAPEKRYPSILTFAEALADSLQQSAHIILPDETTPRLFHISKFTTSQSAATRGETVPPATQPVEQHTDELPQLERKTQLMALDNEVEALAVQENNLDHKGAAAPDFESLLASLLQANPATPLTSSSHNLSDADSMLDTEPALHDKLVANRGLQEYLAEISDIEVNAPWNHTLLQEQLEPQQQKIVPDISQPLLQPEIPSEQKTQCIQQTQSLQKIVPRLLITSHYLTEPREVSLENDLITVGRAGSSDILLDHDNLTSRHHAVLKYDREQYVIFDQRSAQGVYVNDQKLTVGVGWRLTDGDNITIGAYTLIFHGAHDVPTNDQIPSI